MVSVGDGKMLREIDSRMPMKLQIEFGMFIAFLRSSPRASHGFM